MIEVKTMKKIIVLILSLMLIISAVACSGNDNPGDNTKGTKSSVNTNEPVGETTAPEVVLPDKTYDGADFVVWTRGGDWDTDIFVENDENYDSDRLSAAVHKRNEDAMEKFDIKLSYVDNVDIDPIILASEDVYQLLVPGGRQAMEGVIAGAYVEWGKLPYVDTEKPWWNQDSVREFTIDGKLYTCLNDFTYNYLQLISCTYFNPVLIADLGCTENIYDLVDQGKWTFDKMVEIAKLGSADLDKDGDINIWWDQYGFVTQLWGGAVDALYSQGCKIGSRDENGLPVIDFNVDKVDNIYSKYLDKIYYQDYAYVKDGVEVRDAFKEGRALFCEENLGVATVVFRNSKVEYGIVPNPTYDEAQGTDYRCLVNAATNVLAVPVSNSKLEMTGAVMEYMANYGYENLVEVYYESTLKQKGTRDDTAFRMVDLIKNSACVDFLYYLGNLSGIDSIGAMICSGSSDSVATYYAMYIDAARQNLSDAIELFKNNAN